MAKFVPSTLLFAVSLGLLLVIVASQATVCSKTSKNFEGECNDNNKCDQECKAERTLGGVCKDRPPTFNSAAFIECAKKYLRKTKNRCQEETNEQEAVKCYRSILHSYTPGRYPCDGAGRVSQGRGCSCADVC
ncbi:uncharacterized protein LOC110683685 [Chenopodium quinoa]|uniref:uncharacterized protein LOC110683685 n=1 Tax=Chenopodium quinoa TaxID=63459 RepID=UPI000B77EBBA|nr:uncharacterized protein LOC110683685 [Chenopodium quinoa]